MKVIGLTGGIGSGKSTVGAFFKELGATVIDADKVGHRLLEEDETVREQIHALFGAAVFDDSGIVNRKKLAAVVFCHHEKLVALDKIMHPRIIAAVNTEIAACAAGGIKVVIVEAPLLIEAGWTKEVNEVWLTHAPPDVILRRLINMGYSKQEAAARIRCQVQHVERLKYAVRVINTNTSLQDLRRLAAIIWIEISQTPVQV
jgi:dephospho-CoA kinase